MLVDPNWKIQWRFHEPSNKHFSNTSIGKKSSQFLNTQINKLIHYKCILLMVIAKSSLLVKEQMPEEKPGENCEKNINTRFWISPWKSNEIFQIHRRKRGHTKVQEGAENGRDGEGKRKGNGKGKSANGLTSEDWVKIQWIFLEKATKYFKYIEGKERFNDLAYTNQNIGSIRVCFVHCKCWKLFTCSKINARGKTVTKLSKKT